MQRDPDDADHDEVRRIIQIEKPLHAFPLAALPVITHQDRDGQAGKELEHAIRFVDKEEVYQTVHERPDRDIQHLFFEIASVAVHKERAHRSDAGPVGGER